MGDSYRECSAVIRKIFHPIQIEVIRFLPVVKQQHRLWHDQASNVWVERINDDHAHAKRRWQALGAPESLANATLEQLHAASRVKRKACAWTCCDERVGLELELPPHAVAALTVELVPA
jgi:xylan 1,4-beta-xylosidase